MELTPECRKELIYETRQSAIALVEDIAHLREVLATQNLTAGLVRRTSPILRRILIEGALRSISAPRIGAIKLCEPNNNPIYRSARRLHYHLFISGGAPSFTITMRGLTRTKGNFAPPLIDFDPEGTVEVKIDGFLSQKVLCYEGEWISRADVIKYVANKADGVHPGGQITEPEFLLLDQIRRMAIIKVGADGIVSVGTTAAHQLATIPFRYEPGSIDAVLHELLSASYYLTMSEDVVRLEATIKEEIGVFHQAKS